MWRHISWRGGLTCTSSRPEPDVRHQIKLDKQGGNRVSGGGKCLNLSGTTLSR